MQEAVHISAALSADHAGTVPARGPDHASVIAMACLGLLIGPVFVALLIVVPVAVIAYGIRLDEMVVVLIGVIMLTIHAVAARSFLREDTPHQSREKRVVLQRHHAPGLTGLLDDLAARIGAPRVDRLYIGTELNASVAQKPVFGGLAGHRHELTIGLPLLQSLPIDEFSAVVAHELAHLRASDGRLHALVFQVVRQWQRIDAACADGSFLGCSLIRRFSSWFLPRFERRAAHILREGEFAADAVAAQVLGRTALARALIRTSHAVDYMRDIWDALWLQNVNHPYPRQGPWSIMAHALPLAAMRPSVQIAADMSIATGAEQATSGHHPSIATRLARLGCAGRRPVAPMPDVIEPATQLLGSAYRAMVQHFNAVWWRDNRARWCDFHTGVRAQKNRLAQLDAAAAQGGLTLHTAIERGQRAEYLLGVEAAQARFRWCIRRFPVSPAGYLYLGDLMLRTGDPSGWVQLRHARSLDDGNQFNIPQVATQYSIQTLQL